MKPETYMGHRHGVASRAQLRGLGLSERQIDHGLRTGRWVRVHRGVYRLGHLPPDEDAELLAACLATKGVASHRSAARLWELDIVWAKQPEVTVPRRRLRQPHGVTVHELTQWHRRDQRHRRGIPVTGVERTLLDCAAVVSYQQLERLCEAAIRQRLATWTSLRSALESHSKKGRDGCGRLRLLLEARLETTVPLSDFSRRVANLLAASGVPTPVLEYRVVDTDGDFIMQADLAWPERRKICELDGLAYHFGRIEREQDNRKRNRAKAEGWNILEVLWSMYAEAPTELVTQVRRFLET